MKKSVIILIAIIYVASIALVSFFGLQYQTFFEIVYAESIELLDENITTNKETGEHTVKITDGSYSYQIKYRVHPDNVTDNDVVFVYDEEKAEQLSITVSEDGLVKFENQKRGTITVTIMTADGRASTTLKIYAIR